ncbi:hypothetical protein [Parasporobacterium paucivorans]|uniref:Uncharacterized protein n=1 Tax=Parasporobacterium paucivorans DSM 15970 TaxID=1122934 RepID=A0A1M6LSD8_9FIRM|nr:hypothetical protein [Parasporobacterium paucivorans]SHJ74045.1 hypothetical protein SAMN02745691_02442 [Parasporobacterium paucivorans DSM 15970]
MHIMLEPAEVTACEISLELYTDIFCGRYDCLEWHTYQSCNNSSSYKEVIKNSGFRRTFLRVMRDLAFPGLICCGENAAYEIERSEVDERGKASRDMYTEIKARNKICRNLEVPSNTKVTIGGMLLSNYPPIACTCGEKLHHNRCMMIHMEKNNFDVLLDAAAIAMLVYDWKISEVFEFVTGNKIIRDIAQIVEDLYPKIPHRFGSYKEAKRLYDKLQDVYNKEYGKAAI